MTGAPRTASVRAVTEAILYEITKESMAELFTRNPSLVEAIVDVVETRRQKNEGKLSDFKQSQNTLHKPEKEALFNKIRRFFGMI